MRILSLRISFLFSTLCNTLQFKSSSNTIQSKRSHLLYRYVSSGKNPMSTTDLNDRSKLERAKSYPFERPSSSFLFANGHVFAFQNTCFEEFLKSPKQLPSLHLLPIEINGQVKTAGQALESIALDPATLNPEGGFTPVLAIGSNAAPSQLFRKYCGGEPSWPQLDVAVPCVRLGLVDYDVVYCPLLSSYGSIPATLQGSPGTVAHLWVTFLSPPALRRMHETEGGYHCVRLPRPAAFLLPDGDLGGGRGAAWPAEEELLVYVCGYRRAGRQLRAAVDAT